MIKSVYDRAKALATSIQEAKIEKAKLQGQLDQVMASLKERYDLNSVEEAEARVKELEAEAKRSDDEIQTISTRLDEIERASPVS